ncbi:MAG: dimethylmenaquinone methyltransferase [Actinomycetota bacterium]|jgi:4-hydroxy-4-methyl-2-oxoglutarate aldolase|nr:dimethylmenaquinone methyltransferase [Actinomycetota bacterium]
MPEPGEQLSSLGAATLGESGGRPMRSRVRAVWPGARLAAPAFAVRCTSADNLAIHAAVARAPRGSALAVEVGIERELGYWGEVLTTGAMARGITGLVIDGCVRDVAALEAHRFPVFSTGVALPGATKELPGATGGTAVVGEVDVHTGDWLVGDADGVTVVRAAQIVDVLAAGQTRAAREQALFEALRNGKTTLELLGIDPSPIDDESDR